MALNKELEQITEADLKELIASRIEERRDLDYKLMLPADSDKGGKDFVADVSSFANTAGGHLIYGMREEKGEAVELVGMEGDADREKLRLENRIRDGIEPRIPGLHSFVVKLENSKWALVIRIPKSFLSPHMVTLGGRSKFYARMSNGLYELKVDQIRLAFLNSESVASKIRQFRADRIANIRARETPIPLPAGPVIVLHVLPLNAFDSRFHASVLGLSDNHGIHVTLAPMYSQCADRKRINLDGVLVSQIKERDGTAWGYTQLYFNGIIESVDTSFLHYVGPVEQFSNLIPSVDFEAGLISCVQRFFGVANSLGVEPPVVLMLSLLDVRGYRMASGANFYFGQSNSFDRDVLIIPEIVVESLKINAGKTLKPILDSVWNAAGRRESPYYDANGEWVGQRR